MGARWQLNLTFVCHERDNQPSIGEALRAIGLPALASPKSNVSRSRALLHTADYLSLDEATASLDEPAEAALYRLLSERLDRIYRHTLVLERAGDRYAVRKRAVAAAE